MNATRALLKLEFTLLFRDFTPVVLLIAMPAFLMVFVRPSFEAMARGLGGPAGAGTDQAVSGMTILFGFFVVGFVGVTIFREHSHGTWPRMLVNPSKPFEILVGKFTPLLLIGLAQSTALMTVGHFALGLSIPARGIPVLVVVAALFYACLIAIGCCLFTVCRTLNQLNSISSLGTIVLGALSGAVVPYKALPGWIQPLGVLSPGYWARKSYASVLVDSEGFGPQIGSIVALIVMLLIFATIATIRFDYSAEKRT